MAITIPGYNPSSSGASPQGISIGDAVAPSLALGHVARGVGDAAKVLAEHDARIQEVQNSADLTEIKTRMKAAYAGFQQGLEEDHDYKGYAEKWNRELDGLQKKITEGKYSRAVLDEARRQFGAFKGDTQIGVAAAAQRKAVERAKKNFEGGFQMAVDGYDPANPSTEDFDELMAGQSWMTPEEKAAVQAQYDRITERKAVFAEIHEDPRGWLERNAEPKGDLSFWDASQKRAKARVRELVAEQADTVLNGILEGNVEESDIEDLTPDLDAVGRRKLMDFLQDSRDRERERVINSPEEQARIAGEVSRMIDDYEPNGERFDGDFVAIMTGVQSIRDTALRNEYSKQVAGIREGREREIKTVWDWAHSQVREMRKSGSLGQVDDVELDRRTVRDHVRDGFFEDAGTLEALGFSEKQIKKIQAAKDNIPGWFTGKKATPGSRAEVFAELWEERIGEVTADADTIELANELAKGRKQLDRFFSQSERPESVARARSQQVAADFREGKVLAELQRFKTMNPNATQAQVAEELGRITLPLRAKAMRSALRDESASDGAAAPGVGSIVDGYRFLGGNPNDANNWEAAE